MSLTSTYPFQQMSVGDSFTVSDRFQHARVAASEYARRNGVVFSCRMQDDRTMRVHRVENNQAPVDRRGARGRRRIVTAIAEPTRNQFTEWLSTFGVAQAYIMPVNYSHCYAAMEAWCELATLQGAMSFACDRTSDNALRIRRIA